MEEGYSIEYGTSRSFKNRNKLILSVKYFLLKMNYSERMLVSQNNYIYLVGDMSCKDMTDY